MYSLKLLIHLVISKLCTVKSGKNKGPLVSSKRDHSLECTRVTSTEKSNAYSSFELKPTRKCYKVVRTRATVHLEFASRIPGAVTFGPPTRTFILGFHVSFNEMKSWKTNQLTKKRYQEKSYSIETGLLS